MSRNIPVVLVTTIADFLQIAQLAGSNLEGTFKTRDRLYKTIYKGRPLQYWTVLITT